MELREADRLLDPAPMMIETGVERLDSGGLRVAARTDMLGCTGKMFEWWFQSAPDTGRYAWWHPHDHVSSEWREWSPGRHIGSTHVVKESLRGGEVHELLINFIEPQELFDAATYERAQRSGDTSVAICATLGMGPDARRDEQGRPADGKMIHLGRDNDFGLVLRSSFWLGGGVDAPPEVLREAIPEQLGLDLMFHAHTEFKYLSHILPALYAAEAEPEAAAVPLVSPASVAGLRAGVLGAGLMGGGIARLLAAGGAAVRVHDPDAARMAELVGVEGVECVDSLAAVAAGADLVIEAAPEDLALKRELFAALDAAAPPSAILATNSSAISTGEIAAATRRPERVVGTHWWNPPDLVDLVEVIEAQTTSAATVARTIAVLRALGKLPVQIGRDLPGFVGNRLQHSLRREALALVDAGACSPAEVDRVAREVVAPRLAALGLIALADVVGLDRVDAGQAALAPSLDRSIVPARGVRERVARGDLGAKSGRGYLVWDEARRADLRTRLDAALAG